MKAAANSTPEQQPTARNVDFACVDKLYQLHPDATDRDIRDQLYARLSQLSAMLTITCGDGFETFDSWNSSVKENYLFGCAMMVDECEKLAEHL